MTKDRQVLPDGISIKRASAGLGLFATRKFEKEEFVIEYTGEKISHDEANLRGGLYLFTLNDTWVIDGKERTNIARYFNHSCAPNIEAIVEDDARIIFQTIKEVQTGEELTFDYGEEYVADIISKKGCRCAKCHS